MIDELQRVIFDKLVMSGFCVLLDNGVLDRKCIDIRYIVLDKNDNYSYSHHCLVGHIVLGGERLSYGITWLSLDTHYVDYDDFNIDELVGLFCDIKKLCDASPRPCNGAFREA